MAEEPINLPDLECQPASEAEMEGAIRSWCIRYRGSRLLALYNQVLKDSKAGEENIDREEVAEALDRYDEMLLRSAQVFALDQPDSRFLKTCFSVFRAALNDDDASFVDTLSTDWVSLSRTDRLDQLISRIPTNNLGRFLFKPFFKKTESIKGVKLTHYREGAIRFFFFTIFSLIIGVFACAPAAIQSLNVQSAAGEVVVYLVFVITFGWLVQGLIEGFEKLLLTCLAFSGLMATLIRGN